MRANLRVKARRALCLMMHPSHRPWHKGCPVVLIATNNKPLMRVVLGQAVQTDVTATHEALSLTYLGRVSRVNRATVPRFTRR